MADDRKTVLVVDDTPENIRALTAALAGLYKVKAATSGAKALEMCAANPPHLVLLDVLMPAMDGFEVCRRLKADPRTAGVPVIFASSVADEAERETGTSVGAVGFLAKPIDPAAVLACVATHI